MPSEDIQMDLPVRWKIKQEKYRRILRNFQVEALLQSRAVPHPDSSEYILRDVNVRYLSADEIGRVKPGDIQNAINEIFARHGRAFQTAEIASYFQAKSMYHPDASKTDDQITAEFNEYEKANEKLLENRRDELSSTHGK